MPIPSTVADLSTTASANYPAGSESPNQLDDYHRALASIVRQVSDAKADTGHTHTASNISDSTAAGRALLTAADASAQRTALGLGTAATAASSSFATSGAVTGNGNTMATNKLLGRSTASTGAIEEISIGSGLSLSGGTLSSTGASVVFSAYQSVQQSLSASTWTKVNLQTKEFDTSNAFDSTTNYRFTPTTSGYYQINGVVTITPNNALVVAAIYKNGSMYKRGCAPFSTSGLASSVSSIVYLNGTTDYVELWVYSGSSANNVSALQTDTYFNGSRTG